MDDDVEAPRFQSRIKKGEIDEKASYFSLSRKKSSVLCIYKKPIKKARKNYLFIGPLRGQNFVHGLHLKWVPTEFSLTTKFTCTYVRMMYCENSDGGKWREIQKSPKPPTMGFLMGSHRGASLCRQVVHHICSY